MDETYSLEQFNKENIEISRELNSLVMRLLREKKDPGSKITTRFLYSISRTIATTQQIGRLALIKQNDLNQKELDLNSFSIVIKFGDKEVDAKKLGW